MLINGSVKANGINTSMATAIAASREIGQSLPELTLASQRGQFAVWLRFNGGSAKKHHILGNDDNDRLRVRYFSPHRLTAVGERGTAQDWR